MIILIVLQLQCNLYFLVRSWVNTFHLNCSFNILFLPLNLVILGHLLDQFHKLFRCPKLHRTNLVSKLFVYLYLLFFISLTLYFLVKIVNYFINSIYQLIFLLFFLGQGQTPHFTQAESNADVNEGGFFSFAFDSAHVKYGIWPGPYASVKPIFVRV